MLRIYHLQDLCPHLPLASPCSTLPDAVLTSNREGTEAISDTVASLLADLIFLCLCFSIHCLGSKEEMEVWGGCFLCLDIPQSGIVGCLGPSVLVQ